MRSSVRCGGIIAIVLFLWSHVAGLAAAAPAPDDFSFNITPLLVELKANPGAKQQFDIQVTNQSIAKEATFKVSVLSAKETPDGGYKFSTDPDAYSAAKWIKVSPAQFTIGPGRAATIIGEVTVPRNYQGGAYAGVVLELQPEGKQDEEANASTVFRYRMATIVELTVGNRFTKRAHVSALDVVTAAQLKPLAARFGNKALLIRASLTNESNIHITAHGTLSIRNSAGRKVKEIPLGQGRGAVLPGATLDFSSILPSGLPPDEYTLQAVLNYGGLRPAVAKRTIVVEGDRLKADDFQGNRSVRFDAQPGKVELQLPSGAVRTQTVTVVNQDDKPILVKSKAQPLIYDDQGELDVLRMEEATERIDWVDVSPSEFTLRPNERRSVRLTIRNPRDTRGGRYAQVTFTAAEMDSARKKVVNGGLQGEAGTDVVVIAKEGFTRKAEITDFKVIPPTKDAPFGLEVSLKNTGNIHLKATASMTLSRKVIPETQGGVEYTGEGVFETVWEGPLPEEILAMILPGESRRIFGSISQPLEPGHYRLQVQVGYGGTTPASVVKEFVLAGGPAAPPGK